MDLGFDTWIISNEKCDEKIAKKIQEADLNKTKNMEIGKEKVQKKYKINKKIKKRQQQNEEVTEENKEKMKDDYENQEKNKDNDEKVQGEDEEYSDPDTQILMFV